MTTQLETDRLILRPISESDAEDLFAMDSSPNVHKFLGNNPVTSIEQTKVMIEDIIRQYKSYNLGRLAVIKKDSHEFLGWSGLKYECKVRKEFNYYDLGYRFKEKYWGNGYATEAALASLDYGFKDLKLKKICAAAEAAHKASNHILKKVGMKFNGTFIFDGALCNWYELPNPNIE